MTNTEATQIPRGWERAPIKDVARHTLGKMLDRAKQIRGTPFPYLRNINVRWGDFDLNSLLEMNFREEEVEKYSLRDGDLIVCEGGEPGRCAIWNSGRTNIKFQKALHRVRMHDGIDPRMVAMQLRADSDNERLSAHFTGTTIRHFTRKALAEYKILIPPLNEQRRIIAKLEALQRRTRRARAALDAIPPLLEKFRQSVLSAAFRGDLTADWRAQNPDVEPASVLLERIREERRCRWEEAELAKMKAKGRVPSDDRWRERYTQPSGIDIGGMPQLPATWTWVPLHELADYEGNAICAGPFGTIFKAKDFRQSGIPIIFLRHVGIGEYLTDKPGFMDIDKWHTMFQPYSVFGGELLVTKLGDPPGVCAIYPHGLGPAMVTPDVIKMSVNDKIVHNLLLMHYLNSDSARQFAFGVSYGVTRLRMNLTIFRDIPVPLPPLGEQSVLVSKIALYLDSQNRVARVADDCIGRLNDLDQSVLASAFRGELVPQDPNDEPASKLLERIRAAKQDEPVRRGRRRAKDREPKQEAPTPKPSRPQPTQGAAPKTAPPVPNDTGLRDRVHRVLLGRGPLDRDTAIREAASALRDDGTVEFKRLRRDGPLYQSLDQSLDAALAANLLDEPVPGEVLAVLRDARAYTPDDWRHALLACLGDEPAEREDAIEAAALWAAENMGLEFQRLRRDGVIVKGLKSALRTAIRRGEVERLGPSRVRKSRT